MWPLSTIVGPGTPLSMVATALYRCGSTSWSSTPGEPQIVHPLLEDAPDGLLLADRRSASRPQGLGQVDAGVEVLLTDDFFNGVHGSSTLETTPRAPASAARMRFAPPRARHRPRVLRSASMGDPDTPRAIHEAATAGLPPAQTDSGIPVEPLYGPPEEDPRLGYPGQPPFTRGVYPSMYRGRPWTIRLYAGWGSPEDTNGRFRYLLERGQTGLSVALDLPTQMGLDPDHPLAAGEVGKVGVAVDSLADMETIFDGIPLERISTSFTINATASILLAMYHRGRRAPGRRRRRTARDGPERHPQGVPGPQDLHLPAGPSLRLAADVLEWTRPRGSQVQPDLRVRLPHPPGRLRRRAGDRDRALQRPRLPAGGGRPRVSTSTFSPPALVQHLDHARLLRGDRQAPRRAPHLERRCRASASAPRTRARCSCGCSRAATAPR